MTRIKLTPLQMVVHLSAWALAAGLAWAYFTGNLTVNPIQALTQRTGKFALVFLVLSLACTPANILFGFRQALKVRRALGLYAFGFALSHLFILVGLDYGFDWSLLKLEILDKRYILVGLAAFSILLSLAVTSFRWWMKRLGKYWKWLHRLVYLAGLLVILHYAWAKKGDLFRLQGDTLQPFLFGVVVLVLLVLRLPWIRKQVVEARNRLRRRLILRSASGSTSG